MPGWKAGATHPLRPKIAPGEPQADDDKGILKGVMTGSASDPVEWQPHIRNKTRWEELAKRFAVEMLRKLLVGEIKPRSRKNIIQARSFTEMLEQSIKRYQNRAIETAQVIEEQIALKGDKQSVEILRTKLEQYESITAGVPPSEMVRTVERSLLKLEGLKRRICTFHARFAELKELERTQESPYRRLLAP